MPPKPKPKVVRWLVRSRYTGDIVWLNEQLSPYLQTQMHVLAYGMDDGTVRWDVDAL